MSRHLQKRVLQANHIFIIGSSELTRPLLSIFKMFSLLFKKLSKTIMKLFLHISSILFPGLYIFPFTLKNDIIINIKCPVSTVQPVRYLTKQFLILILLSNDILYHILKLLSKVRPKIVTLCVLCPVECKSN